MVKFSNRLKEFRLSHHMSQQELADKLGMAKSTISMYEQGKPLPSYEVQEQIADLFNVDLDYLIGRSDRTTIVMSGSDASPERRFLMDKIAKADDKQLSKIKKLMELIANEETDNW